jgi:RNA polymerase sigma-70 factor (ECF subfamily)
MGHTFAISPTWFGVYNMRAVEIGLTYGGSGPKASTQTAFDAARDEDTLLVAHVASGDAHALERIYDHHSRGVYSLALRLLGDTAAAEEVVQETFLKLWRQPGAYQPSRGRLLPWLLGVAHHQAVDMLRRRQLELRHRATPVSPGTNGDALADVMDSLAVAAPEDDPQLRAGAFDQQAAIGHALAALPVEQRVPLELAYYHGLTQYEVATLLGVPLGTIKTRMRLGLQQLRKMPELLVLWSER